jgi:hypothetical protein
MCSDCFEDAGLEIEARRYGKAKGAECKLCGSKAGHALDRESLDNLANQFFSYSTASHSYQMDVAVLGIGGGRDDTVEKMRPETWRDWLRIKEVIDGSLFYRSPRLFYLGVTNHFGEYGSLQKEFVRREIVPKLREKKLSLSTEMHRIRLNLTEAERFDERQFDAPPDGRRRGFTRFDHPKLPILYASPNLQVCIHECRVTLADEIFMATLSPTRALRLIDLTGNFEQPADIDPFDDLEWFFRGLMYSSRPSVYRYCRRIAQEIRRETGADGFAYNSYFTNIAGDVDGPTINYALFGHPIAEGKLFVDSINVVKLESIRYGFHLGPVFV